MGLFRRETASASEKSENNGDGKPEPAAGAGSGWTPPKKVNLATVRRVAANFAPYWPQVVVIILAVLASAGLGILTPWYLRKIVDQGLALKNLEVVTRYTLYTIAATVGSVGLGLVYGYLSVLIGQRIMRDLRNRLYAHLQGMSLRFFTGTRTGDLQSRLANDVGGMQSVVSDTLANVLSNLAAVLTSLAAMFYLDWRLTLLAVGVLPLFALLGTWVGNYARGVRRQGQEQLSELNSLMQETLSVSGALLTKTSGRRARAIDRFRQENDLLTGFQVKNAMIQRYFFTLIGFTFSVTPALVYWLAGYLMARGDDHLTLGTIVAFTSMQARFFFPLTGLMNAQVEVLSAFALFDRVYEYLDTPQEITEKPDAIHLRPEQVRGDVAFERVSFAYEPGSAEHTLADLTFSAPGGSLVALVGPSGAGKTTLTYLLARLYDVDSGRVTIDGHDVRDLSLETLAEIVGVVTQETYLVHDTIRENLRYGRPDASDADLEAAARAAAIHQHIVSLPEGYDTVVGERGYKLSGGEKQRIAIARALLKNPRLLILDEATSALDTASERAIQQALEPLMHGRTTFAIAHRLSTILAADLILVMQAGRIVERGTHTELLAQGGLYARLYRQQIRGESANANGAPSAEPDLAPA
jgi:ATP-binding cassette, subfamily B, bacterial